MRGAHLALAVNNPKTTLLMATVKFFHRYKQSNRHQTSGAAWATALVEASENIHHAQFFDGASQAGRQDRAPKASSFTPSARSTAHVPFASFADRSTSVSDKEYLPYECSAAARSHAAGTPGHAPEGVLAVVCLDDPRDNTRGKGPLDFRRVHWDPRRNAHGVCQMLYRHGWSVTF